MKLSLRLTKGQTGEGHVPLSPPKLPSISFPPKPLCFFLFSCAWYAHAKTARGKFLNIVLCQIQCWLISHMVMTLYRSLLGHRQIMPNFTCSAFLSKKSEIGQFGRSRELWRYHFRAMSPCASPSPSSLQSCLRKPSQGSCDTFRLSPTSFWCILEEIGTSTVQDLISSPYGR